LNVVEASSTVGTSSAPPSPAGLFFEQTADCGAESGKAGKSPASAHFDDAEKGVVITDTLAQLTRRRSAANLLAIKSPWV